MLQTINKTLGKIMPLLTPLSVVSGVLLADYLNGLASLVPWIFAFMTFAGSLGANFQSLNYVKAFCFQKQQIRMFKIESILSVFPYKKRNSAHYA
ncbi:hypothetical protein DT075_35310 [Bacillus licheniformis]|nr:hypothetical protein DT075_35310 [Bacillus licheniformis]